MTLLNFLYPPSSSSYWQLASDEVPRSTSWKDWRFYGRAWSSWPGLVSWTNSSQSIFQLRLVLWTDAWLPARCFIRFRFDALESNRSPAPEAHPRQGNFHLPQHLCRRHLCAPQVVALAHCCADRLSVREQGRCGSYSSFVLEYAQSTCLLQL